MQTGVTLTVSTQPKLLHFYIEKTNNCQIQKTSVLTLVYSVLS